MRTLLRREVLRQSPGAIALLVLAALIGAGFYWSGTAPIDRLQGLVAALEIVALGAPFLLGLNSAAPDAENGGAAFLGRLPISRWRELGVRWGVAVGLAIATTLLSALAPLALAVTLPGWVSSDVIRWLTAGLSPGLVCALPLISFALGAVASTAVGRTLHALVLAPFFLAPAVPVLVTFVLTGSFLDRLPGSYGFGLDHVDVVAGAVLALAVLLLVAGGVAHVRGDVHRRSFRPATVALAILFGASLATTGLMGTATAGVWTYCLAVRSPVHTWTDRSPGGRFVLESETLEDVYPAPGYSRVRVVDRGRGVGPWIPLEEGDAAAGFTPDGGALVSARYRGHPHRSAVMGLETLDTHTLELIDLPRIERAISVANVYTSEDTKDGMVSVGGPGPASTVDSQSLVWRGREPLFVATIRDARTWSPSESCVVRLSGQRTTLPGIAIGVGGSRILVRTPDNAFRVVDVSSDPFGSYPLELPPGLKAIGPADLSPSGNHAFVLACDPDSLEGARAPRLAHFVLAAGQIGGAPSTIDLGLDRSRNFSEVDVLLSPSESHFALVVYTTLGEEKQAETVGFRETRSGAVVLDLPPDFSISGLVWSPAETRVAGHAWWAELGSRDKPRSLASVSESLRSLTFVDEDRLLFGGETGGGGARRDPRVVTLSTGKVTPMTDDLWGKPARTR